MIQLNLRDSRPIYEQIQDEFKKLIISGVLSADEKLPSVRTLASSLSINPNTIQRAYNELEMEGFLYSIPGKGSFVSSTVDPSAARIEQIKGEIRKMIEELRFLKVPENEICMLVERETK